MANYQKTIIEAHNKIYNSIIDKIVSGDEATESELAFIVMHENKINNLNKKSPMQQIINGAKQILSVFAEDKGDEK